VIEHFLSMHKALDLIPNIAKKQQQKKDELTTITA
jgi:hypothetical protein